MYGWPSFYGNVANQPVVDKMVNKVDELLYLEAQTSEEWWLKENVAKCYEESWQLIVIMNSPIYLK